MSENYIKNEEEFYGEISPKSQKHDLNSPLFSTDKEKDPENYESILQEAEQTIRGVDIGELVHDKKIDLSILFRLAEEYQSGREDKDGNKDRIVAVLK